ncbi:MAG: efflux RND transporter periplasmic adaptor subunit [Bacteroidetes bacterium]|nr:efflux RND transporter periplasmic adaptor subunit [Bacteroidota bacterium]
MKSIARGRTVIPGITLLLFLLAHCTAPEQKHQPESKPVSVKLHRVAAVEYQIPVRVTGSLVTATQMKLSFKTGGIINQVNAKEGRAVSKGDVLAALDLSEIRAQVSQADIGLEKSRRDMNRAKNLYQDSVATLEQYQNSRSAFELARAQKQIADFNFQHSWIKAPSDGEIMKILVETNEVIGPGYPAILFASTENDWVVRAALTDKDIVKLLIGDSANVTMDAFPETIFRAVVTELGSVADPVTGTYESELLILQAHPQFRTGFFSRAEIYPAGVSRSLAVPIESLLDASDNMAHVFVYADNSVSKRLLKTGRILGETVVVVDGLDEGEWIVTEGAKYLRADDEVVPVNHIEGEKP